MAKNVERARAFLRLWLTPGLGVRSACRLLEALGDPRAVDLLSRRDLQALGISTEVARDLSSAKSLERAATEWDRADALGVRIIDRSDPDYPPLLGELTDPPLVLYVRGDSWNPAKPHVAIVGSRRPSPYGINCAGRIARDLAARDVVVVSGLARGIDAAAHRGALDRGRTVAVMGTGVDRIYPAENRGVAESTLRQGALISELPIGTLPLPQNFPRRNRILAGLTLATVVVEAAEKSGSLITARLALEANREVFAVPGPIYSPKSRGPHQLIQQGACLITGWEDIARELAPKIEMVDPVSRAQPVSTPLSAREQEVLKSVPLSEDVSLDHLLSNTKAAASDLYAALLELELRGLIRRLAGDRYIRNETQD